MPKPNGVWTAAERNAYYTRCDALANERIAMGNMLMFLEFVQHEFEVHHNAIRDARPERGGPFAVDKVQRAGRKMLKYAEKYSRFLQYASAAVYQERWNLPEPIVEAEDQAESDSKASSNSSDERSQDDVDFAAASDSDSDSDDGVVEDEEEEDTPPPPPAREPRHARAPRYPRPVRQFAHAYHKAGRKRRFHN